MMAMMVALPFAPAFPCSPIVTHSPHLLLSPPRSLASASSIYLTSHSCTQPQPSTLYLHLPPQSTSVKGPLPFSSFQLKRLLVETPERIKRIEKGTGRIADTKEERRAQVGVIRIREWLNDRSG
jgi:hypothetical protein